MIETTEFECLFRLWIGNLPFPSEVRELGPTSLSNGIDQALVVMADEILEWRFLSVFLAHEQHGSERRKNCGASNELQSFQICQLADAVAKGAIAHLIVILNADDKLFRSQFEWRISVAAFAMRRVYAVVIPAVRKRLGEMMNRSEVPVVSGGFFCDERVQGVMKIVAPLPVHT